MRCLVSGVPSIVSGTVIKLPEERFQAPIPVKSLRLLICWVLSSPCAVHVDDTHRCRENSDINRHYVISPSIRMDVEVGDDVHGVNPFRHHRCRLRTDRLRFPQNG